VTIMSKWRWTAVVLAVLVCVASAGYLATVWPSLIREPVGPPQCELPQVVEGGSEPISGQLVGQPESSIVEQFGPPTRRSEGHYGNPPVSYRRAYRDAITVTYVRPTGTLYLSFCTEQDRLVCFSSDWLPTGVVF
jgi:hypothetical protein